MTMSPRNPDQRRALELLAGSLEGHTEAMLMAHGFTIAVLAILVRDGFATATPETVRTALRATKVVRMRITEAGRQAITE
jgi:hypothetical protein